MCQKYRQSGGGEPCEPRVLREGCVEEVDLGQALNSGSLWLSRREWEELLCKGPGVSQGMEAGQCRLVGLELGLCRMVGKAKSGRSFRS